MLSVWGVGGSEGGGGEMAALGAGVYSGQQMNQTQTLTIILRDMYAIV